MPEHFRKPDSNASNHEVTEFLTNKYVHKKWANNDDWSHDPAWLFENKPKKFQKYVAYYQENFSGQKTKKASYKKNQDADSDSSDEAPAKSAPKKVGVGLGAPPAGRKGQMAAAAPSKGPDLLSFDAAPASTAAPTGQADFFGSSAKADDGFGDFAQSAPANNIAPNMGGQSASNVNQQTINIQNLYQMYQANPHSANDKYSALDSIQIGNNQQAQNKPFVPMAG